MREELIKSVLYDCQNMMTEQIGLSMASMMDEIESQLNYIADREKSLGKAIQYYAAIRLLKFKQQEIQVRFEKRFVSIFKYRAQNYINNNANTDITLSKVGHSSFVKANSDFNEKETLEKSVYNVKQDCRSVLMNIDKKMSVLMQDVEPNHIDNPMLPETIFEAFWESCRDIKLKKDVRLLLIKLFEKYLSKDLKFLYENINENLAKLYLNNKN